MGGQLGRLVADGVDVGALTHWPASAAKLAQ